MKYKKNIYLGTLALSICLAFAEPRLFSQIVQHFTFPKDMPYFVVTTDSHTLAANHTIEEWEGSGPIEVWFNFIINASDHNTDLGWGAGSQPSYWNSSPSEYNPGDIIKAYTGASGHWSDNWPQQDFSNQIYGGWNYTTYWNE